jgi:dTDP-4-dehydrorhamnose 3,5-epimerase
VLVIEPETAHEDFRGTHTELFNEKAYLKAGIKMKFVQDNISISSKHVLRGVHGDNTTWKLVSCLLGRVYLLVVNWDKRPKQYRKWTSFVLSDRNREQVLIPPRFGNGHLVMSNVAVFHYRQSTYYDRKSQFSLRWDDPSLGFWWPVKNPILSRRDEAAEEPQP